MTILKLLFTTSILLCSFFTKSQNCAANAGLDQTICVGQPLTLNGIAGNPQFTPPFIEWAKVSGTGAIITTPNATSTTITGFTPGNYVFKFSNRCADNILATDIVAVTVLPLPPTAIAGTDITQCTNAGVPLNATPVTAPNTGTWTVLPVGGTFSPNANAANATYTPPAGSAIYTLTWTVSNGFCNNSDNLSLNIVAPATTVSAGADITLSCGGSCVTLNGSNPGLVPPQGGLWTLISGPNTPIFVNPTLRNTQVCGLVPGSYTLRWTVNGVCASGFDEINITVSNIFDAPVSSNVAYTNFCTGGSNTQVLTGSPLSAGETGVWTLTSGQVGVTFTPNNTSANVTANGLTGTFPYTFTWVKTNAAGCSATGTHTVHRNPTITNLSTPLDVDLACDATTGNFTVTYDNSANVTSGLTRTGIRISGPAAIGSVAFSTSGTSGANRTDTWAVSGMTSPGTYVYRVEYRNSCGTQFRDVAFTVSRTPGNINAGSDITLPCNTLTANPIGAANAPGSFTWSQLSGPNTATLTGINTLSLGMSSLVQGTYRMRLSISAGKNCPAKTDDMIVVVTTNVPSVATTGANATICAGRYRLTANTPNTPLETGTWTVTPSAGVTFNPNANTPNAQVSGLLPNTAYTFRWTVSNSCGSIFSEQILTTSAVPAPPLANAGADVCLAVGTSTIGLNGNAPDGSTITWTTLDAASSVSPLNTQSTTATLTASGTYRFEYALSVPGCTTMIDTVTITRNQTITTNAGTDIDICAATIPASTSLVGSAIPSGTTAMWTQISGPVTASIGSNNTSTTAVSNLQVGIYGFQYSIGAGGACPRVLDTVMVRVVAEPSNAAAGPDQSLCNVSTATTVTLAATTPTVGAGYWQIVSGPPGSTPTFSNSNANNSTISNLMNGSYTLRWTSTNGAGCPDKTDDVVINITAAASAKPDFNLCNAPTTQLTGNANTNGVWTLVSGTPIPTITDNAVNETATVSGLVTGATTANTYTFRYTLPAVGACPSTFDDVIINNYPAPSQADAGPDFELCFNTNTVTLTGVSPTVGTGSWVRESGPNTPTAGTTNAVSRDTILNNIIAGLYVYRYQVNTNAACIASVDKVQVVKEITANAKPDIRYCIATSVNLNATPTLINAASWSQVSGPNTATFNNINAPNAIASGLIPGTYLFRWAISSPLALGCALNSDDVTVIIDPAVTGINAGTDATFCQGSLVPFQLGSAAQSGVTYSWTAATLLDNAAIAQPTFNGVNNAGTYTYTVKGTIGTCEAFDQVVVKVNPLPFASITANAQSCPSVFTASDPGAGVNTPTYSWNFGSGASPATASGQGPHNVTYPTAVTRNISLSITTVDGCSKDTLITITTCSILPIELYAFNAVWKKDFVNLNWEVSNAISFQKFEIERSYDGINFINIGKVFYSNNFDKYDYNDYNFGYTQTKIYYRLKLVNIDQSFDYSDVKVVNISLDKNCIIFPNPFSSLINIAIKNYQLIKGNLRVYLINNLGQVVLHKEFQILNRGQFQLNNLTKLPSGVYTLKIIGEKNIITSKLIKQ